MENKATNIEEPRKKTYGVKSKYHQSQSKYLEVIEKDLLNQPAHFKSRLSTNNERKHRTD